MDEHLISAYGDQEVWFVAMWIDYEGWDHTHNLTYREAKERYDRIPKNEDRFIGIRVEG
jgi:hypothetical protein